MTDTELALLFSAGGAAFGMNIAATYLIFARRIYTAKQKLLQLLLTWLLPYFGSGYCIMVIGSDVRPPPPPRKEEFYENVGA